MVEVFTRINSFFARRSSHFPIPTNFIILLTRILLLCAQKVADDFAEDPFKDYRYEDVFNIEDPFADEVTTSDQNDSSSMDDIFAKRGSFPFPLSSDFFFISNYDLFPVDMFSDVTNSQFTADSSRTASAWPPQSSATSTTTSVVSRPKGMAGAGLNLNDLSSSKSNNNLDFANFANVFQNTATASSDPFLDKSNNNSSHSKSNTNGSDELFADFNDNFGSALPTTTTTTSSSNAFDPFGISTSNSTNNNGTINNFSATFDDDDDDAFGNAVLPKKNSEKVSRSNGDGKKSMKNINNNNSSSNVKSDTSTGKFSADYSKNFETDLEEVLKRSVFEQ